MTGIPHNPTPPQRHKPRHELIMNSATEHYLHQHRAIADTLPGRGLDWLQAQRRAGLARFEQVGFPTQRDEDWRYTAVKPIITKNFQGIPETEAAPQPDIDLNALKIPGLQSHRMVFVDGLFAPQLSDDGAPDAGVVVESLARVLDEQPELVEQAFGSVTPRDRHGFTALNNASSRDGVVLRLAAGAAPTMPVEMLFVSRAEHGLAQPRNLIIADKGTKAEVIERHLSLGDHSTFTNSATEIVLGEEAELDYYLVQTQSAAACHVCGVWAKQSRASRFSCRTVTLGGALVRNDLGVDLAGEEAHCDMFGLYHPVGIQHVDNHTTMIHGAENCTSRELYKGVIEQRARAVFHGRIVVRPGAQKTNAAQTNNNLLLSRHAEIDTKPQLEIYADDVKCSHGATVGQIDRDALFYLRSRGIDEARAQSLLTFAFVNDVLGEIQIDELKHALENTLATRLAATNPSPSTT